MILVDTSVWIRASRRRSPQEADELDALLARNEVVTTGMVLAEVLQGARNEDDLNRLLDKLVVLDYLDDTRDTWVQAARLSSGLAKRGLTTPLADLLIAAVAMENDVALYAVDDHFKRVPGLKLHEPPQRQPE